MQARIRASLIGISRGFWIGLASLLFISPLLTSPLAAQDAFVNWESPHVHPLDRTPDGTMLLAVNTADARLERFSITIGGLVHFDSISVGLDPITVRVRSNDEAWVVNHISDSVSVVDLTTGTVVETISTLDEPADVVFTTDHAFVSCTQPNRVLVYDLDDLTAAPETIEIFGEEPKALAVSDDGTEVYVAIFESGNGSTILGGLDLDDTDGDPYPPNIVSSDAGPHDGANPPPNDGTAFSPAETPGNPDPPPSGLIVKKNADGDWLDDTGGDWTEFVTGTSAELSGRPEGWDLPDHDVAVIDTETFDVSYVDSLMNICMSIAVHPDDGTLAVIGTDGTNEIRFEPNLNGVFLRVLAAFAAPDGSSTTIHDLNPHLDYSESTVEQSERDKSIGDPRALAYSSDGSQLYICGLGSNNVVVIDRDGERTTAEDTIEVGVGPTGLVLDETNNRLFVLNRFGASISIVDTETEEETEQVSFFDPTPSEILEGRPHFYDTHQTSGLGHVACASCHVDGRMDRLAWDLGNPAGEVKDFNQNCLDRGAVVDCEDFHPMKGARLTQTLQDIIGKEPLHWSGDKDGLEEFSGAFEELQGDDETLTTDEMQEFEDFLDTITFPPNPFRNLDNSLPTDLPLPGHFSTGRFASPAGTPLPNGNAEDGLDDFRILSLQGFRSCVTCHTLPTGLGRDSEPDFGGGLTTIPTGSNGEHHIGISPDSLAVDITMKVPHLRNLYDRVGFDATQLENTAGFGFLHDGSVDSLARFLSQPNFETTSDQQIADLLAFLLAFSGSDLPEGDNDDISEPLGVESQDTHAAVGVQVTVHGDNSTDPAILARVDELALLADDEVIGLIAKGRLENLARGFTYIGAYEFQSDRASEIFTVDELVSEAADGAEITFTAVPFGTQERLGVDRDSDGAYDRDERDVCSDPADPTALPGPTSTCSSTFDRGDCDASGAFSILDPLRILDFLFLSGPPPGCEDACDGDDSGEMGILDALYMLQALFSGTPFPPAPQGVCGADPTDDALTCEVFAVCP